MMINEDTYEFYAKRLRKWRKLRLTAFNLELKAFKNDDIREYLKKVDQNLFDDIFEFTPHVAYAEEVEYETGKIYSVDKDNDPIDMYYDHLKLLEQKLDRRIMIFRHKKNLVRANHNEV